jgi:hypothetical protein
LVVGEDGFALFDALDADEAAAPLRSLPAVQVLRTAWARHYERTGGPVRWRADAELPRAAEGIESPYDPEARYRTKRDLHWTGYMVHVTETCDKDDVHIVTHVMTTTADVHEARCTTPIHRALVDQGLPPDEHLVDAAYVDAELLVSSQHEHGIDLVGPPRSDSSWQTKVEGAYDAGRFTVDWEAQRVTCPEGKVSSSWSPQVEPTGAASIAVKFRPTDCGPCVARALCTRAKQKARALNADFREAKLGDNLTFVGGQGYSNTMGTWPSQGMAGQSRSRPASRRIGLCDRFSKRTTSRSARTSTTPPVSTNRRYSCFGLVFSKPCRRWANQR